MTKRDFFILAIKLFGLYSLVFSILTLLPSSIPLLLVDFNVYSVIWLLIVVIVVFGLFMILIQRADKVVRFFKIDRGFDDERIEFGNSSAYELVKIGTFVIGGLMIIENLPYFLYHVLCSFKRANLGMPYEAEDKLNWAIAGINILVGLFLVLKFELVANLFKVDRKTSGQG